ncbi:hypothetical protein VVR46_06975 [Corynebacterium phoceense]
MASKTIAPEIHVQYENVLKTLCAGVPGGARPAPIKMVKRYG